MSVVAVALYDAAADVDVRNGELSVRHSDRALGARQEVVVVSTDTKHATVSALRCVLAATIACVAIDRAFLFFGRRKQKLGCEPERIEMTKFGSLNNTIFSVSYPVISR